MPPPPGLDRVAARSLQKLKDRVQWLEIQPLTHMTDDHVIWLRLWLLTGVIVVALILTTQWNRFTRLARRQLAKPRCLDGAGDSELNFQRLGRIRKIPPGGQLISEAIAHQMDCVVVEGVPSSRAGARRRRGYEKGPSIDKVDTIKRYA